MSNATAWSFWLCEAKPRCSENCSKTKFLISLFFSILPLPCKILKIPLPHLCQPFQQINDWYKKNTNALCYKCLEFGHISLNCPEGRNLREAYFKCCSKDHEARNCGKHPHCILYAQKYDRQINHSTGILKCLVYIKAVKK